MTPSNPSVADTPVAPARVLVVDDERYLQDLVALSLKSVGHEVLTAADGAQALEVLRMGKPDLVVLDVMLPDIDGFEVCRRIRATGNDVPVLFLTAKDALEDTLDGLRAGGDQYMTKPFSIDELVLRVAAILRRSGVKPATETQRLQHADLVLDLDTYEVWRAGIPVELTATEFNLLRTLLGAAGRVLTKGQLLEAVWDYDFGGNPNILETYISYLRRKVDIVEPPLIQTVRGVGYTIRAPRG